MLIYWLLVGYFALGALITPVQQATPRAGPLLIFGAVITALLIGLRYEVGGDWETYAFWFKYAGGVDLGRMLEFKDPAYQVLNWSAKQLGFQIWVVNLVCGAIFSWGLLRFVRTQPDPWLAMLIAVPYLVVVVAMGYTRQAVAIGILMAGLASVRRGASTLQFALWVGAAALFHRTAVVMLPLLALAGQRNRFINLLAAVAAFYLLYDMLLEDSMDAFIKNYVKAEYSSQGAAVRVFMNLLPAIIFLFNSRRLGFTEEERALWRNFALVACVMVVLLVLSPSSTAVDRISLYIIPIQIAVLDRIPMRLASGFSGKALVVGYSAAVLFVWLNFGTHADKWLPYRFYPL